MKNETIAAIATGLSNAGISIVRVSGPDAIAIVNKIFKSKKNNKSLLDVKSHTIHYGYIADNEQVIDEVLVSVMKAPNSYTAENTVEINCHGGTLVTRRILNTVLKYGARVAEPGEFTKRAFLNGRIDLTKAEAVIDVINAKNNFALKNSMQQLQGKVAIKIRELRETILYHIAYIESALDDPEHISLTEYGNKLLPIINSVCVDINHLIRSYENGKMIKEGIRTVIVGKPNAGKSSFLNLLLGEDKAIVTDVAGTTRDIIEENIQLNGIGLTIMDTAGIRNTEDVVEKIGVEKTRKYVKEADLIIYIVDSSVKLDENDNEIIDLIKDKNVIILLNKTDLETVTSKEDILKRLDKKVIEISTKENIGINEFEKEIMELYSLNENLINDEIFISNVRQKEGLENAGNSLQLVKNSIMQDMPEDFYSIDLMDAYTSLGSVLGEEIEDDFVKEIFSKFCMGK